MSKEKTTGSSRDVLGEERTALANERTLLAYIRTALAFMITGASMLRFFDSRPYEIGGIVGLTAGVATFALGFVRYAQIRRQISKIEGRMAASDNDIE